MTGYRIVGYDYGTKEHGVVVFYPSVKDGDVFGKVDLVKIKTLYDIKDLRDVKDLPMALGVMNSLLIELTSLGFDVIAVDADLHEVYWGRRKATGIKFLFLGLLYRACEYLGAKIFFVTPGQVRRFWNLPSVVRKNELHDVALRCISQRLVDPSIVDKMTHHEVDALIIAHYAAVNLMTPERVHEGVFTGAVQGC